MPDREPYQRPTLDPGDRLAEVKRAYARSGESEEAAVYVLNQALWLIEEAEHGRRWVPQLREALNQQNAEVDRLRGLLRDLEWAGGEDGWSRCPACGASAPGNHPTEPHLDGHAPNCWLAAELHG